MFGDAERSPDALDVDGRDGAVGQAHLAGDALTVLHVEVHDDGHDLGQDVDGGGHLGHGPVEEDMSSRRA